MAEINCPMCGKPNPDDLDVCQFCEARLKPLTDALSRAQPPIPPGQEPTPIDTSELEPILPQWLREVRQQARDSAEGDQEQTQAEEEAAHSQKESDLLAGLRSQADEDEEIPDWLSRLGGGGGQETSEAEKDDTDTLRSMLGEGTSNEQVSEASSLPGWISDLGENNTEGQTGGDELSAFIAAEAQDTSQPTESQPAASSSDLEWAADFGTDEAPQVDSAEGDIPNWPASFGESSENQPPQQQEASQPVTDDALPDWLSSLGEESSETIAQESAQPSIEGDTPDWLSAPDKESADATPQQETVQPTAEDETPDWLSAFGEESAEATSQQEVAQPTTEDETPDWLSAPDETGAEIAPQQEAVQPTTEDESPDWLKALDGEPAEIEQPVNQVALPDSSSAESVNESSAVPAFIDDEGEPLATDDVDALLSDDVPDWLSEVGEQTEEVALASSSDANLEDLRPADLPNWVQEMRPVESVISETTGADENEQPMEERGPLAGLRGVLPAVPGAGPSSIPKAYSIKLQASEDQQFNATMLEKMLAEEINPKPIITQQIMLSQRVLRWFIAILLLLVVGGTILSGTQINPIPTSAPLETSAALRHVEEIPADAPVLMIFDYEAALSGELEATAAPLIDHMLTLKHPRLCMVASTSTGTGLAELFMETTQSDHNYQSGEQYTNLGYLPGGAAGVLAFAENPKVAKPLSNNGENAWNTPVLQGVGQLSDFAAIILLTNDAESARTWIEQTERARGDTRLLVISSAQSGPMILPYAQSGQVDGMVTGLDGSAPIEQANSGRPGTVRRYWDAYGFGLLTAVAITAIGSLWSLVAGWQARRKEQVGE